MALINTKTNRSGLEGISASATQLGNGIGIDFRERDVLLIAICRQIAPDGRTLTPAGSPMFASHTEALELIKRGTATLKTLPALTPPDPVVQAASIQPPLEVEAAAAPVRRPPVSPHNPPDPIPTPPIVVAEEAMADPVEEMTAFTKVAEATDVQISEPVVGAKRQYTRKVKEV